MNFLLSYLFQILFGVILRPGQELKDIQDHNERRSVLIEEQEERQATVFVDESNGKLFFV